MKKHCLVLICLLCASTVSYSQDNTESLINILREKGILSEQEIQMLYNEAAQQKKANTTPSNSKTSPSEISIRLHGRLHIDTGYHKNDKAEFNNGTEIRRARLNAKGTMGEDWEFRIQVEYGNQRGTLKDAFLSYVGHDNSRISIGQFGQPASLDDYTSSRFSTFIERALPILAYSPASRRMGISYLVYGNHWSFASMLAAERDTVIEIGDEGGAFTVRGTYSPWSDAHSAMHFGAWTQWVDTRSDLWIVLARPEAHIDDIRLVNTGLLTDVKNTLTSGLETSWVKGPWSIQGEWIKQDLHRENTPDSSTDGYYLYGSYFITGESRNYQSTYGAFSSVTPLSESGAWEVALRFSHVDLNNDTVFGGEESNITLATTWYINKNLRFMLNYINVKSEKDGIKDNPDILLFRTSLFF
ncbi:MAG: hypothetical protein HRU20_23675 [Pseudomonadales bacterium]|nr:hypothetical protein [Pseudomonadales bacterium]